MRDRSESFFGSLRMPLSDIWTSRASSSNSSARLFFSSGGNVLCLPVFPVLFVCWARGALLVFGPAAFAALFSALCVPVVSAL